MCFSVNMRNLGLKPEGPKLGSWPNAMSAYVSTVLLTSRNFNEGLLSERGSRACLLLKNNSLELEGGNIEREKGCG